MDSNICMTYLPTPPLLLRGETHETSEFKKFKREEARRWLVSIRSAWSKLQLAKEQVEEMRNEIGISGVSYDDTPHSPNVNDDAVLNLVVMYEKAIENLNFHISEYEQQISYAQDLIYSLKSHPIATEVILRHFLNKEPNFKIAQKTNYSERLIKLIETNALEEIYELLPYSSKTQIPKAI